MSAADTLCANLPHLLHRTGSDLPGMLLRRLGFVQAHDDAHVLVGYIDAFGATCYSPMVSDILEPFRPRSNGQFHLRPVDLARNTAGLIESRLMHTGLADEV